MFRADEQHVTYQKIFLAFLPKPHAQFFEQLDNRITIINFHHWNYATIMLFIIKHGKYVIYSSNPAINRELYRCVVVR